MAKFVTVTGIFSPYNTAAEDDKTSVRRCKNVATIFLLQYACVYLARKVDETLLARIGNILYGKRGDNVL